MLKIFWSKPSNRNQWFHSDHTITFQAFRPLLLHLTVLTVINYLAGMEIWRGNASQFFLFYWFFNCFGYHIVSLITWFIISNSASFLEKASSFLNFRQVDFKKRGASGAWNTLLNRQFLDSVSILSFVAGKKERWAKISFFRPLPVIVFLNITGSLDF